MIDNKDKDNLHWEWNLRIFGIYIVNGIKRIIKHIWLIVFPIITIGIGFILYLNLTSTDNIIIKNLQPFIIVLLLIFTLMLESLVLFIIGMPLHSIRYSRNLHRINIVNSSSEAPLLIGKQSDGKAVILTFYSKGIPLSVWQDNIDKIESALNLRIDYITEGNSVREIVVRAISGKETLPKIVNWEDKYLSHKDFELVLGKSYTDFVSTDLSKVPHILIGGSTGSGKSVLLKILLYQCIHKSAEVYIADFKGGVDYGSFWKNNAHLVTDQDELIKLLSEIIAELEYRKELLNNAGVCNISEYNSNCNGKLKRIIVSCDEVAELLDKTGLAKNDKDRIYKIEGYLSTIARQGRAFGIHLILATQRPDATILNGQIKNNIDYRVCGRADIVLSEVILDKGIANDRIPKNSQGRFINQDETVFQAFWLDV